MSMRNGQETTMEELPPLDLRVEKAKLYNNGTNPEEVSSPYLRLSLSKLTIMFLTNSAIK